MGATPPGEREKKRGALTRNHPPGKPNRAPRAGGRGPQKRRKTPPRAPATVVDLPGIYSLSPYTSEEIVTRDFLIDGKPDGIINIVDATNIERNLYLTMQLIELGIPMVIALNMMDEMRANGNTVDVNGLEAELGVPVSYMGIISMIISGGTVVSSLFSDKMTRKFGTRIVTVASVFLTVIALFGFSFSSQFWMLAVFAVPYGLGAGAIDSALNNYVALH